MRCSRGAIVSSAEDASLTASLGIKLPGMTFPSNSVSLAHSPSGFEIKFSAENALELVGPADPKVQVVAAELWKRRKGREDVPELVGASDWTFTTRYAGTVKRVEGCEGQGDVGIDYENLRRIDVPILFFDEVILFEDELDDQGHSSYIVRLVRTPIHPDLFLCVRQI
jgi:type 2A phosphatase activator TIP41